MKYFVGLLLMWGAMIQQGLSEAEISQFQAAVQEEALRTKTLSAKFEQTKHSQYLAKPARSEGRLYFQQPGSMLWQYASPAGQQILVRDERMYVRDGDKTKEMPKGKRTAHFHQLIKNTVSGEMFNDHRTFSYNYTKKGGQMVVRMIPKEATLKRYFKEVELTFTGNAVTEVRLFEPSGDHTHIVLKNKEINRKLPDNQFKK